VVGFIVSSTAIFLAYGRPVSVLIWAGTINGFILPVGLTLILLAARKSDVVGSYRHSTWLQAAGWIVVGVMAAFSILTVISGTA
jgi:Mn2+/Fe2+ NRAMP family transporter